MPLVRTQSEQSSVWDPGFPYLMSGVALASIWLSYILGALFSPGFVTGVQHDHFNSAAATGWIFDALATASLVTAALQGIRAKVADRAPWAMLGFGVSTIWIAVMFVAIFAPVWVTGTDPDRIPFWSGMAAIAGVVFTWLLCRFVKSASFEPVAPMTGPAAPAPSTPAVGPEEGNGDATVKLRQLAQLRDTGVITDAEFQAKKQDLLSRI